MCCTSRAPSRPSPGSRATLIRPPCASIEAWRVEAGLANLLPPVSLDARAADWPVAAADAILCINMVHISPWAATVGLMRGAGRLLAAGAPLYLYGAYRQAGVATAPSNEAFDAEPQGARSRMGRARARSRSSRRRKRTASGSIASCRCRPTICRWCSGKSSSGLQVGSICPAYRCRIPAPTLSGPAFARRRGRVPTGGGAGAPRTDRTPSRRSRRSASARRA